MERTVQLVAPNLCRLQPTIVGIVNVVELTGDDDELVMTAFLLSDSPRPLGSQKNG